MPDAVATQIVARALERRRLDTGACALDVLDAALGGCSGHHPDFGDAASKFGSALDPREPFGQLIVEAFDRGMAPSDWLGLLRDDGDLRVRRQLLRIYESDVLQRFAGRYRLWGATTRRDTEPLRSRSLRAL